MAGGRTPTRVTEEYVWFGDQQFRRMGSKYYKTTAIGTVADGANAVWELRTPEDPDTVCLAIWWDSADALDDVTSDVRINNVIIVDSGTPCSKGKPVNSLVGFEIGHYTNRNDKFEGTLTNDSGGPLSDIVIFGEFEVLEKM